MCLVREGPAVPDGKHYPSSALSSGIHRRYSHVLAAAGKRGRAYPLVTCSNDPDQGDGKGPHRWELQVVVGSEGSRQEGGCPLLRQLWRPSAYALFVSSSYILLVDMAEQLDDACAHPVSPKPLFPLPGGDTSHGRG